MSKSRRSFAAECKREAVQMIQKQGLPLTSNQMESTSGR